jgi:hypothetical protein
LSELPPIADIYSVDRLVIGSRLTSSHGEKKGAPIGKAWLKVAA